MKKTGILAAIMLSANLIISQTAQPGKFTLRASGGATFSNFLNSQATYLIYGSSDYKTPLFRKQGQPGKLSENVLSDYAWGITAGYDLKKSFSLQLGMSFSNKGLDIRHKEFSSEVLPTSTWQHYGEYRYKIRNRYLSVPVSIRKQFGGACGPYVEGGVYGGFLISSEFNQDSEEIDAYNNIVSSYSSSRISGKDQKKERTNAFDFGYVLGAGYSGCMGKNKRLILELGAALETGLRKLDARFNNESDYVTQKIGDNLYVTEKRNYYGYNSYSKNIQLSVKLGIGYRF